MFLKNLQVFLLALLILPNFVSANFVAKKDQLQVLKTTQAALDENPGYHLRFFLNVPGKKTDVISSYATQQAFGHKSSKIYRWHYTDDGKAYFRLPAEMQGAVLCTHVLGDIQLPEKVKALFANVAYENAAFKGYMKNVSSTRSAMQQTLSKNLRIASDSNPRCGLANMKTLIHAVWSPQNLGDQKANDFCQKINAVPGRYTGENCLDFNDYKAGWEVNDAPYRFHLSDLITAHIDYYEKYNCQGTYCGLNLFFSSDYEAMAKKYDGASQEKYAFVRLLTPQRYTTENKDSGSLLETFCIADPRIGKRLDININNFLVTGSKAKDFSWKLYMAYYNLFRSQYLPSGVKAVGANDINRCGTIIGQPQTVRMLVDSLEASAKQANITDVIIPTVADFDVEDWALRSGWGGKGNYDQRLINKLFPDSSTQINALKKLGVNSLEQLRELAQQLADSSYSRDITAQVLLDFKQHQNLAISQGLASATAARQWQIDEAKKRQEQKRLAKKAALKKQQEKEKQRLAALELERQRQAEEQAKQEAERQRLAAIAQQQRQKEVAKITQAGGYKILGISLADPISTVPKACRIKSSTFKDIMGTEFSLLSCSYKDRDDKMQIIFKGQDKAESILRIRRTSLYQPFTKPSATAILKKALKHYGGLYSKMGYYNADQYNYDAVPGQELSVTYHLCTKRNQMLNCVGKALDAIEYELRSNEMTSYIEELKEAALNVNEERF